MTNVWAPLNGFLVYVGRSFRVDMAQDIANIMLRCI